jgi:valyl-tRNA synthetase
MTGNYTPQIAEPKWQNRWEELGIYKWDSSASRADTFVIDTPPPTVSGMLHMGHVFSYTQADFIARFQRMIGKTVFYPMGFDDNGLPTERLVEKVKKVRAASMPRAEFIKLCQTVIYSAEEDFRNLFRSIALSVDWQQEYQTISPTSQKLSQLSFIDLWQKGNVKRQYAPCFWDAVDRTAIAQAEIIDQERQGVMYDIKFSLADEGEKIVIATTRPEMLAACVAVFYHPDDERYKHLAGKFALTPIYQYKVPLLADEGVAIDKGTGLVMCCTFGDIQDIDWWRKHKLPAIQCINHAGKMQNAGFLDGLSVIDAKTAIADKLDELKLLVAKRPVTQFVKCAERSGAPLEIIPTDQWYVAVLDHKDDLKKKAQECNWHPEYMRVRIENWIDGLNQDWCISRQRYFGVPFPVWYSKRLGEEGKIIVARPEDLPVDPNVDLPAGYARDEVEADTDVMDTWATSSITPQLNSHGISEELLIDKERHQKLFPADLRPQAHEIIRTWGFYTLVKAFHHSQSIPWKHLMISGWCLAADKTKMSKSKGNVVTPMALIHEKGTDVVRYWASTSKLGVDIAYSEECFKIGKKLVNKLWNAAKFCSLHLAKRQDTTTSCKQAIDQGVINQDIDIWLCGRLQQTVAAATKAFELFEYSEARMAIENFFWNDFCDNYLEIIKARVYDAAGNNPKGQQSAICTMYHTLRALVHLFAPILPHITEEINEQILHSSTTSVHQRGSWPKLVDFINNAEAEMQGVHLINLLELVRKAKSTANLSLRAEIVNLACVLPKGALLSPSSKRDLANAANAANITMLEEIDGDYISSEDGAYRVLVNFAIAA